MNVRTTCRPASSSGSTHARVRYIVEVPIVMLRPSRAVCLQCQNRGHYSVPDVEAESEELYTTLQIGPKVKEQIRSELNHEAANWAALIEQDRSSGPSSDVYRLVRDTAMYQWLLGQA